MGPPTQARKEARKARTPNERFLTALKQAPLHAPTHPQKEENKGMRSSRIAHQVSNNPLVLRLKEDVTNGKVDLAGYGFVPKSPKPAWWIQKAKDIYVDGAMSKVKKKKKRLHKREEEHTDKNLEEGDTAAVGHNVEEGGDGVKKDDESGVKRADGVSAKVEVAMDGLSMDNIITENGVGTKKGEDSTEDVPTVDDEWRVYKRGRRGSVKKMRKAAVLRDERQRLRTEEEQRMILEGNMRQKMAQG